MTGFHAIGAMTAGIVGIVWRGYVLSVLWAWFVATPFGVPAIGAAQAVGLWLVTTALTHRYIPGGETRQPAVIIGEALFGPLLLLAAGWIARGCM